MQFGTPVPLLIGLILIIGAVVLFFLDKIKPGYGRDSDKVYSVLLLVAGMCALGELQLGIFPSFQLLIMAGMLITLLIENIRNRVPLEPVRPGGGMPPRGGRPRPGDRRGPDRRPVYRAELDDWDSFDDRSSGRSMPPARPYEDDRYRPRPTYDDRPPMRRLNPGEPMGQYDGNSGRRLPNDRPMDRPAGPQDGFQNSYGPPNGYRDSYDARGPQPPRPQPTRNDYPGGGPSNGGRPAPGRPPAGLSSESRPMESRPPEERRSTERTLDVRPYSEAPGANSDSNGDDYLDFRPVEPEGPKDDSDWR
ncbi:MAG: Ycf66 family protein [Cyanobacteria bacterium J06632_22]